MSKPEEELQPVEQPVEEEEDDDPFFADDSEDSDAMAFLEELDTQMRESDNEALDRAHRHFWIAGGILITVVVCYTMVLLFR